MQMNAHPGSESMQPPLVLVNLRAGWPIHYITCMPVNAYPGCESMQPFGLVNLRAEWPRHNMERVCR